MSVYVLHSGRQASSASDFSRAGSTPDKSPSPRLRRVTWRLQCEVSSSHRQTDRQVVHPQESESGRRSTTGSHGPSAAVRCVDSSPTTTRLNQCHVVVEEPSIWSLTDRLCHGILQMGYDGTQVLCEVGVSCQRWGRRCDHGLGMQLRVGLPRILTAQT